LPPVLPDSPRGPELRLPGHFLATAFLAGAFLAAAFLAGAFFAAFFVAVTTTPLMAFLTDLPVTAFSTAFSTGFSIDNACPLFSFNVGGFRLPGIQ